MRCYYRYIVILILVAVVIGQVFCNDATTETHNREKRQDFHGPRGHRRDPHHREGGGRPDGHHNGPRGPPGPGDERFAQPLSLSSNDRPDGGGRDGMNEGPRVEGRFGEMQQDQGFGYNNIMGLAGMNLGMGMGGGRGAQGAPAMGFGGMPGLGGFRTGMGGLSYPSTMAPNSGLLGLGGQQQNANPLGLGGQQQNANLLGLGGQQQNGGLLSIGGQSNALINIGGSAGLLTIGGQNNPQTDNRPQGPGSNNPQQGRPGNNSPGQQGSNRPSGQQSGGPGGRPGERPGQYGGRPTYEESNQNGRPGGGTNTQNGRPGGNTNNQNPGHNGSNGRPNDGSNFQNQGGGSGGGGSKKCRGNQYTCQNRECVQRNARCNGVNDCRDGSDEINCSITENRDGGHGSTVDRTTTAAPHGEGDTNSDSTDGCILPEQPTGGSYELGSCQKPCNRVAGNRVPLTSFLTYKCNNGYTLNGNNVTFCHDGAWYLPPTCVKTCSPLKSNSVDIECKLDGKTVSCETAIAPGTKATLACKPSFKIPITEDPAYRELNCLEEGIWDRTLIRCLPECGTAVSHGNTLIVNGFTAKLGVFPWHVGIYQKNRAESFEQICAGSLVSPDLVVSAAHCFYDDSTNQVMDASQYAVAAGKHYRLYNMPEKYAQTSTVKSITVATRYYGASGNFAEDISLVRLNNPFTLTTLVRPVCMDWENVHEREQFQSGQSGKAVGWGKTAEGEPSTELQEVNLPYIPYQECVSAVPEEFKGYVTADKFCAGYLNGTSLCEGDSGGGLCFQLNGLWYLRGIVSVSPVSGNTCDNNYYTAFTNVGRFREWIRAAYVSTS